MGKNEIERFVRYQPRPSCIDTISHLRRPASTQLALATGPSRDRLTLPEEAVLREGLLVIIDPGRQVRVRIGLRVLLNVRLGGEVFRIAAKVDRILWLVDSHVVDAHDGGENEVVQVDLTEIPRHTQVGEDVL